MKARSCEGAATAFAAALFLAVPASAQVTVDPKIPEYKPVEGVSGSMKSIGSDTMNNLMALWAEGLFAPCASATPRLPAR